MASTITAFNEFSAQTLIRSADMNTNFDNFRGTMVPINTDTATASDATHDLGASDHRWSDLYLSGNLIVGGSTFSSSYFYSKTATGSYTSPITATAALSLNLANTTTGNGFNEEILFLIGDTTTGTDITTGVDQIRDGDHIGQKMTLIGTSDTSTVALQDGDNLNLNGGLTLYQHSSVTLIWESTATGWIEISRRN